MKKQCTGVSFLKKGSNLAELALMGDDVPQAHC